MIYILTVHWKSALWIDVQLEYLRRNIREPFRVFACCEGIPDAYMKKFDLVVPAIGAHAGKLNLLASEAALEAKDDDLLIFLDGDAFPIVDPLPSVRAWLREFDFVAVRRSEIFYPQPHPSFCVLTAARWRQIQGDWSAGYAWPNPWFPRVDRRPLITDVGGNLLRKVETLGLSWKTLERTNSHNPHAYFFGVYGNLVYHHGGGFAKVPIGLTELAESPFYRAYLYGKSRVTRGVAYRLHRHWARWRSRPIKKLSRDLLDAMRTNPRFYEKLTNSMAVGTG